MAIPKAIAYSPRTTTDSVTLIAADEIKLVDVDVCPSLSLGEVGVAVLCEDAAFSTADPADYETVTYTGKSGALLTGVTREVEGTAREWASGTAIASFGTAYGWEQVRAKLNGIEAEANKYSHPSTRECTAALALAGGTMTGDLTIGGYKLTTPKLDHYREMYSDLGTGGDATIDVASAHVFRRQLDAACTLTFTNPGTSDVAFSFTLLIKMDSSVRVITWPSSVKWAKNTAPSAPAVSKCAIYTFYTVNNGTRWYGFQSGTDFDE